ncbi:MAG: hypothetical protein MZV70_75475 [Desulfobacterales bacterium]|nr:hypothetical protein [Desulfobacterales bacterium]
MQTRFPIVPEPFDAGGAELGISGGRGPRTGRKRLKEEGIIRRIGAVFDLTRLGFASTLRRPRARGAGARLSWRP